MAVYYCGNRRTYDLKSVAQEVTQSIPEGERRLVELSAVLASVEYVKVDHLHRQDSSCFIYGEIAFSNYAQGPFFTLFKRSRDDPQSVDLSDTEYQYLTLSDDDYYPPLQCGFSIFIRMKLYETKQPFSDSDDNDGEGQSTCSQKPARDLSPKPAIPEKLVSITPDIIIPPEEKPARDTLVPIPDLGDILIPPDEKPDDFGDIIIKKPGEKTGVEDDMPELEDIVPPPGEKPKTEDEDMPELEDIVPPKTEDEDILIVDDVFECNEFYQYNKRYVFELEGLSGFLFYVGHAYIEASVPVEVRFTINKIDSGEGEAAGEGEAGSSASHEHAGQSSSSGQELGGQSNIIGKRKWPRIELSGSIAAAQNLTRGRLLDDPQNPILMLFERSPFDPESVCIGSPIHLDRKFVIAPAASYGILFIVYNLSCNGKALSTDLIPFPFLKTDSYCVITDKNLCHTRTSKDGVVSVSLKFMTSPADLETSVPDQNIE